MSDLPKDMLDRYTDELWKWHCANNPTMQRMLELIRAGAPELEAYRGTILILLEQNIAVIWRLEQYMQERREAPSVEGENP